MLLRMCDTKHTCLIGRMEADSLQGPGTMDNNVDGENPFEPYLNYIQKELDYQDPILIIGIIVALAVIVITLGKFHNKLSTWVASKLANSVMACSASGLIQSSIRLFCALLIYEVGTMRRRSVKERDIRATPKPAITVELMTTYFSVSCFSVFLKYFVSSKTVRSSLLLVGLCDSGKTLLYSRVCLSIRNLVTL